MSKDTQFEGLSLRKKCLRYRYPFVFHYDTEFLIEHQGTQQRTDCCFWQAFVSLSPLFPILLFSMFFFHITVMFFLPLHKVDGYQAKKRFFYIKLCTWRDVIWRIFVISKLLYWLCTTLFDLYNVLKSLDSISCFWCLIHSNIFYYLRNMLSC